LSKLAESLSSLHRRSAPIGFAFSTSPIVERRMLVLALFEKYPGDDVAARARSLSDFLVFRCVEDCRSAGAIGASCGCWPASEEASVEAAGACDFLIVGPDAPAEIIASETVGWVAIGTAGDEAGRVRAVAELGAEAVLVPIDEIDPTRVAGCVELRRIRLLANRPVVVKVDGELPEDALVALFRAGVDALVVPAEADVEVLAALRGALESTAKRMRTHRRDETVSLVGAVGPVHPEAEPDEEEYEEEDE